MLESLPIGNKNKIENSLNVACVYCGELFSSKNIINFTKESDGSETAICPFCGVDSIITDSELELTEENLQKYRNIFFGNDLTSN